MLPTATQAYTASTGRCFPLWTNSGPHERPSSVCKPRRWAMLPFLHKQHHEDGELAEGNVIGD
ncbi:hypothetical protein KCP73_14710 [Salmonella enterica subsp. enterica]|nr:hypothetical protein KCP73_14710 [Salmonella enterica subsp. enterica]